MKITSVVELDTRGVYSISTFPGFLCMCLHILLVAPKSITNIGVEIFFLSLVSEFRCVGLVKLVRTPKTVCQNEGGVKYLEEEEKTTFVSFLFLFVLLESSVSIKYFIHIRIDEYFPLLNLSRITCTNCRTSK